MKAQRAKMKANEGPKGQNKRKWNQPQPETLEHVVALWLRKQKLRKQGRGSSGKGYMWKVCRGRWRCGRGSTAEAVAEAMNNFLSTRKEKKQTHLTVTMKVLERCGRDGKNSSLQKRRCWHTSFSCCCWESEDPTKKTFDLIIGIFGLPPRTKPPEQGHFVGDCFWLGTDFCRTW